MRNIVIDEHLHDLYCEILKKYPESLFSKKGNKDDVSDLSGLFLTAQPAEWAAGRRVLVIGRETSGWNVLKAAPYTGVDAYVRSSMMLQKAFLKTLIAKENEKGCKFRNLLRDVGRVAGTGNVAWANLLCLDWKGGMIDRKATPFYNTIIELSEKLLKTAIQILEPDIIIFANGVSSAHIRRKFFPMLGQDRVCSSPWTNYTHDGIQKIELESFVLYGHIRCYRINHPSSRSTKSRLARQYLLRLLKADLPHAPARAMQGT